MLLAKGPLDTYQSSLATSAIQVPLPFVSQPLVQLLRLSQKHEPRQKVDMLDICLSNESAAGTFTEVFPLELSLEAFRVSHEL